MQLLQFRFPFDVAVVSEYVSVNLSIGRVSLARENEAGAVGGRRCIFYILTYSTSFCFWL